MKRALLMLALAAACAQAARAQAQASLGVGVGTVRFPGGTSFSRSEEHTSELQSRGHLACDPTLSLHDALPIWGTACCAPLYCWPIPAPHIAATFQPNETRPLDAGARRGVRSGRARSGPGVARRGCGHGALPRRHELQQIGRAHV